MVFSQKVNKLDPTLRDACIIAIILSYNSYELFRVKETYLGLSSVSQPAKYKQMWELRRRLIIPEKIIDRILSISCSREIYLQLVKKHSVRDGHQNALTLILFFIYLKEGGAKIAIKAKNLILRGHPNSGKSRLIAKFIKLYGSKLFHFVGERSNDFTGYRRALSPILVWDDALFYPRINWRIGVLLKLFAHEPHLVDVKYRIPIWIVPTSHIILTNYDLFYLPEHSNLLSRVHKITLGPKDNCSWSEISDKDFELILGFLLNDLIFNLEDKAYADLINYGDVRQVLLNSSRNI